MKKIKIYNSIVAFLTVIIGIFFADLLSVGAAPPIPGNLILNPDMQITSSSSPMNWQLSGFSDVFTGSYPVSGPGAVDKAAQITTTAHNLGDAKWAFDNVAVSEGALYTFSDSYNSNVPTALVVAFTPTGGTSPTLFTTIATLNATNGLWQTTTQTLTVPLGFSFVTVYHTIATVGSLTTANYSLLLTASAADNIFPQGMVSLTFDDGWSAQYDNALPVLKNANKKGTFFVVSQKMLDANAATADNLLFKTAHPDVSLTSDASSSVWSNIFTDPTNKAYRFTDFYMANATSTLEVTYKLTNATTTSTISETLAPSVASSSRASFVFTLPGDPTNTVTPISVTHKVSSGSLSISSATLTGYNLYMNTSQLLEAQAAGSEIGSHTVNHCNLVSGLCPDNVAPNSPDPLTAAQEISVGKSTLIANGFSPVDTFAYPYGAYSTSTQSLVASSSITVARSINAGFNTKYSDKFALNSQVVDPTVPLSRVYQWIDTAINNKWWLVLVFHQVEDQATITANNDTGAITPETLNSIVSYLNNSPVKTLSEAAALMITKPPVTVYSINSSSGANGNISPLGITNINSASSQTYTITPQDGYQVQDVLVDGVSVGPILTYSFTNVIANHSISVSFTAIPQPPVLTTGTGGGGGGGGGTAYNSAAPNYIESINTPLIITSTQSGRMSFILDPEYSIIVNWPQNVLENKVIVNSDIIGLDINNMLHRLPIGADLVGSKLFRVIATDYKNNQLVNSLAQNISITLGLPLPNNLTNVGVYYFDEVNNQWVLIPGAIFNQAANQVQFNVNHLTIFGVFKTDSLASVIPATLANSSKIDKAKIRDIKVALMPKKRSASVEARVAINFKLIYGRLPNSQNINDENAIMIMAYGLWSGQRNLSSEKQAVKTFVNVYGRKPTKTQDQNIIKAIAYSGETGKK